LLEYESEIGGTSMFPKLTKEARDSMKEEIRTFFYQERDEEIGEIATEAVLDFCLEKLGPYLYNEGILDAIKLINERNMNTEEDLHSLMRSVSR
jgi:uncharacterized protein (DUF2164 family)